MAWLRFGDTVMMVSRGDAGQMHTAMLNLHVANVDEHYPRRWAIAQES
jgi:hypothetical protein